MRAGLARIRREQHNPLQQSCPERLRATDHMPALQEHLIQLHRKLEFAERSDMAQGSAALRDVAPELDRLRIKTLFKAREFLIARFEHPSHCCGAGDHASRDNDDVVG